jgi:hypothetical protein
MVPETATIPAPGYTAPVIQAGGFSQAKYDELKRYSAAAAESYKAATLGKAQAAAKPAEPKPAPKAGDVGYYSPQAARLMEQAKTDVPAAAATARGMVAAPPSMGFKMPEAAPDPSEEYGGIKEIEAAPDPSELYGGVVEPYKQPEASPEAVATSAKELAGASPAKVGDVIDKLKAEEARGGPGFWDVLQAAAAGWQGQVPLYVQKELARKEEEATLARAKEIMGLEKAQRAEEMSASQSFQRALAREEMENRLKLAGIGTVQGMGGLNLGDLMIPGAGGK